MFDRIPVLRAARCSAADRCSPATEAPGQRRAACARGDAGSGPRAAGGIREESGGSAHDAAAAVGGAGGSDEGHAVRAPVAERQEAGGDRETEQDDPVADAAALELCL